MSDKQLLKTAKQTFEPQQEESDCGVAALLSVIKFYGGYVPLERLREISGTTSSGTSMLGILQAARANGLDCEPYEGNMFELKRVKSLAILHVLKNGYLHYLVFYGMLNDRFIVGDPDDGILIEVEDKINDIWKSKAVLIFTPNEHFKLAKKNREEKFQWLFGAVKKDKSILISTLFLGVIITSLSFTTAIFTEKLVDNLLPSKDNQRILLGLLAWFCLMSIRSILSYLRENMTLRQAFQMNNSLVGSFLLKMFQLPKSFFDRRKKGDLISRLIDTEKVQSSVSLILGQDIIDLLTLIVSIIIVFTYQSFLAFFLLILIFAYFLIARNYYEQLYRTNKVVMSLFARNESEYIDQLTGLETIKQLNKSKEISNHLRIQFMDYQSNVMNAAKISAKFRLTNDYFGLLGVFFILIYSVVATLENAILIGDMLAIFSVCALSLNSTGRIALATIHLQEAQAALDRTFDLISEPAEENEASACGNIREIELKQVSFGFPGAQILFDEISFSIRKGTVVGIIGDNGSGKSTILQLIQGFYPVSSGEILVNDVTGSKLSLSSVRHKIGVVPQEIKIFNRSLLYNITLDDTVSESKFGSFLKQFQLQWYVDCFPHGIDTILGEEGVKVSGGQKQIIGLARALFNNPDFLLLDEFSSSMDQDCAQFSTALIEKLKFEKGILLISHDSKIIELADSILFLRDQKLMAMG